MNKAAIKAELRRSACEDKYPASDIRGYAYPQPPSFRTLDENPYNLSSDDQRIFFLFVAEAL